MALSLQKLEKEPLRRTPVSTGLDQNVDRVAILIDGSPQIELLSSDFDEHLVKKPRVTELALFALQPSRRWYSRRVETFFNSATAEKLMDRIDRLSPERRPLWGCMSCPEMVCHLADAFSGAMGDNGQLHHRWNLFDVPPIRRLLVFTLPWAHGLIPAPAAFQTTSAEVWSADIERLKAKMFRFLELEDAPDTRWQVHPLLGRLTTREWGWLAYRHTDYHLRQFGV